MMPRLSAITVAIMRQDEEDGEEGRHICSPVYVFSRQKCQRVDYALAQRFRAVPGRRRPVRAMLPAPAPRRAWPGACRRAPSAEGGDGSAGSARPSSSCSSRWTWVAANRSRLRAASVTPCCGIVDGDGQVVGNRRILAREDDVALRASGVARTVPASSSHQYQRPGRVRAAAAMSIRRAWGSRAIRAAPDGRIEFAAGARIDAALASPCGAAGAGGDFGAGAESRDRQDPPFSAAPTPSA